MLGVIGSGWRGLKRGDRADRGGIARCEKLVCEI